MRIAFNLVKERHALIITIFLIVAALAVVIVACDGAGAHTYQLTISSSSGGNVTDPGEGTFTYDAGIAVPLVSEPDDGYRFHLWTGDIQLMAGPNLPTTTIVMNGNYAITATFEIEDGTGPGMP